MQNLLGGANYLAEELIRYAVTDVVLHGAARRGQESIPSGRKRETAKKTTHRFVVPTPAFGSSTWRGWRWRGSGAPRSGPCPAEPNLCQSPITSQLR